MNAQVNQSIFADLKKGDKIGIISTRHGSTYGRVDTVTHVAGKSFTVGATRFSRDNGSEQGGSRFSRTDTQAYLVDDPRFVEVLEVTKQRNEQAIAERRARDRDLAARFEVSIDDALALSIAKEAVSVETKLLERIKRLTPASLYRELKWLEGSGDASSELNWYLSALTFIAKGEKTSREIVESMHASARERFENGGTSCQESRDEMFGARSAARQFDTWLKYGPGSN